MLVTVTNLTSDPLFLSAFYKNLDVGGSVTAQRSFADIDGDQELKKHIVNGDVSITTTPEVGDGVGLGNTSVSRTFTFSDTDVALAATTAVIDLTAALPAGATVVGIFANITADWDDGAAGTFSLDIGNATDPNKFTATTIAIDGGIAVDNRGVYIPAGGDTLKATFTGSANLSTLTSGAVELIVYYHTPENLALTAP